MFLIHADGELVTDALDLQQQIQDVWYDDDVTEHKCLTDCKVLTNGLELLTCVVVVSVPLPLAGHVIQRPP